MTEQEIIERIDGCKRYADFEKLIYDCASGRVSRSDSKMLVSQMRRLIRKESTADRKTFMVELMKVKQDFFAVIAR